MAVEEINDQKDKDVELVEISDNNNTHGWVPEQLSDYVDIRLAVASKISKIEVLESSNVKMFNLILQDLDEKKYSFEVSNNKKFKIYKNQ